MIVYKMNIFVVDLNPVEAAQQLVDKHVIKMILESAQMLCGASSIETPYKKTHLNHPCSKCVRESRDNFDWLVTHALALNDEYRFRFNKNRDHASVAIIRWCVENIRMSLPQIGLTTFAQAVPEKYKHDDVVTAYRNYYIAEKTSIAIWTNRQKPIWFKN